MRPVCAARRARGLARAPRGCPPAPRERTAVRPRRVRSIFLIYFYIRPAAAGGGRRDGLVRAGSSDSEGAAAVPALRRHRRALHSCRPYLWVIGLPRGRGAGTVGRMVGRWWGRAARLRVAAARRGCGAAPHAQANGPHETTPRTMQPIPCATTHYPHTHTHTHTHSHGFESHRARTRTHETVQVSCSYNHGQGHALLCAEQRHPVMSGTLSRIAASRLNYVVVNCRRRLVGTNCSRWISASSDRRGTGCRAASAFRGEVCCCTDP